MPVEEAAALRLGAVDFSIGPVLGAEGGNRFSSRVKVSPSILRGTSSSTAVSSDSLASGSKDDSSVGAVGSVGSSEEREAGLSP